MEMEPELNFLSQLKSGAWQTGVKKKSQIFLQSGLKVRAGHVVDGFKSKP
jgi:hypothetical protein